MESRNLRWQPAKPWRKIKKAYRYNELRKLRLWLKGKTMHCSRNIRWQLAKLSRKIEKAYRYSELRKLRLWLKGKTMHWSFFMGTTTLLLGVILGLHIYLHSFVYVVFVGDKEIGLVRCANEFGHYVDDIMERCSALYGMAVEPKQEITLHWEYRPGSEPDVDAAREAIRREITLVTEAVVLVVDGVPFLPVGSEEEVDRVIELLCATYIRDADNIELLEVSLGETVSGEYYMVTPEEVRKAEEIVDLLIKGGTYRTDYQFASRGATSLEVERSTVEEELIPVIRVITREEETVIESIPFSTQYTYTDRLWYVQSNVLVPGKEGSKQVVYEVTRENGSEIERQKISEQVLEAPTTRQIERGTARVPSMGTGQFVWPVEGGGRLTQGFRGWNHAGIDISFSNYNNRHNTRILAADSGVVVKTGSEWPMGNYLIIYHGRYYSVYLHNRTHLVSQGSTVSKGQPIAIMGNTGRTRGINGIHLHFEIRVCDGSGVWNHWRQHAPIDPLTMFRP